MKKIISTGLKAVMLLSFAYLSRYLQLNFMVGSENAYFSGINIMTPLMGSLLDYLGVALVFAFRASQFSLHSIYSFSFLANILPGIGASMYWTKGSFVRLWVPIVCMVAFIAHPVGSQAFVYSLYWLIPIAIYFIKKDVLFLHALASTFVAHAIGSVIWLYTVPMTVAAWYALLPVVILERVIFASGIVLMHVICSYLFSLIDWYVANSGEVYNKKRSA